MNTTIFQRDYSAEELCDVDRDVSEAFEVDFNKRIAEIPTNEYGFMAGTFQVTIKWFPDEESV